MIRRLMALRRRLRRDVRGAAAVEFALIAPVLILFYFGVAEFCQAFMAERKTSHVAATVGDLVAQNDALTSAQMTDIFNVSGMVISPFTVTNLKMCVAQVTLNSTTNKPTVGWVKAYNGASCYKQNDVVALPMNTADSTKPFINPGESVIYAQAVYSYASPVHYLIKQNINFSEVFYMRPRKSDSITMN